jgi:hypothetical protein
MLNKTKTVAILVIALIVLVAFVEWRRSRKAAATTTTVTTTIPPATIIPSAEIPTSDFIGKQKKTLKNQKK